MVGNGYLVDSSFVLQVNYLIHAKIMPVLRKREEIVFLECIYLVVLNFVVKIVWELVLISFIFVYIPSFWLELYDVLLLAWWVMVI